MKLVIKKSLSNKTVARLKKKVRNRSKVVGTGERPRLTVYRSNANIYAQIVNDDDGKTIVAFSTVSKGSQLGSGIEAAKKVGQQIAKLAIDKKVSAVVFDRNGYGYHGKIKALAEAAREAGLKF